jgi:hypothetical protein
MDDNARVHIARIIDAHDQPVMGQANRRRIALALKEELQTVDTTAALSLARQIRKSAVHDGLYVRPERKYANPIDFRSRRRIRSMPWRTSTDQ